METSEVVLYFCVYTFKPVFDQKKKKSHLKGHSDLQRLQKFPFQ